MFLRQCIDDARDVICGDAAQHQVVRRDQNCRPCPAYVQAAGGTGSHLGSAHPTCVDFGFERSVELNSTARSAGAFGCAMRPAIGADEKVALSFCHAGILHRRADSRPTESVLKQQSFVPGPDTMGSLSLQVFAGFLFCWAMLHAIVAVFCWWAASRPKAEPGGLALVRLCAVLSLTTGAEGFELLSSGEVAEVLCRISLASAFAVPPLIIDYFRQHNQGRVPRKRSLVGVLLVLVFMGLALAGQLDPEGAPTLVGRLGAVIFAGIVIFMVLRIGEVMKHEIALGPFAFAGGLLLAASAVYDAVIAAIGIPHVPTTHAGFAAFAAAFFAGHIARVALLGEQVRTERDEIRTRSEAVSKSFRALRVRQDELVRKEQLAAVGELAAVIAHEVRNPLAIIMNAVSALKKGSSDRQQLETLFAILTEETTRLNRIVGDLLHYARPLSVADQSVDVAEIVERAVSHVRESPSVEVELIVQAKPPRVRGDAVLVRQAIDNVLNNALQAMGAGGSLQVNVRASTGASGVDVTIRDTGEGMDTVVRKRALDPFFTTRPTGTGLGLAIVSRVVDAHHGRLTIRSERGAGTEVCIFFPREAGDVAPRSRQRLLPVIEPFRTPSSPDSVPDSGSGAEVVSERGVS